MPRPKSKPRKLPKAVFVLLDSEGQLIDMALNREQVSVIKENGDLIIKYIPEV